MEVGGVNLDLTSGVNQLITIAWIALILFIIVGVIMFVIFLLRFKHKIRIRKVVANRKTIVDDKFREFKDPEGNIWFQLMKKRIKLPVAPPEAIETDEKGRMVVECYLTPTGDYQYCMDKGTTKEIPEEILAIKNIELRNKETKKWKMNNNIVDSLQPLTTNQRTLLITQIRKAEERKRFSWKEHLPTMVSIGAIVILIVCLMIFWGDIAKPALESKQITANIVQDLKEMKEMQMQMNNDVQIISSGNGRPVE